MTLSKRLKALEKEMGQGVQADRTDQGKEPRITWEEAQERLERIRTMTHDELKAFIRQEGNYPARGIAPKRGQLPNPDDYDSLDIHKQVKLYFARREDMTPREWQTFYTKLLESP